MTDQFDRHFTVLIVDDSESDRYILKRYLKKTGLPLVVLEADSGKAGFEILTTPIEILKAEHSEISFPVTLFLDINMPLMNGWEFIEKINEQYNEIRLKPAVVVMYSTADTDYEKKKARSYPTVADYIVKGETTPDSLKKTISTCSGLH